MTTSEISTIEEAIERYSQNPTEFPRIGLFHDTPQPSLSYISPTFVMGIDTEGSLNALITTSDLKHANPTKGFRPRNIDMGNAAYADLGKREDLVIGDYNLDSLPDLGRTETKEGPASKPKGLIHIITEDPFTKEVEETLIFPHGLLEVAYNEVTNERISKSPTTKVLVYTQTIKDKDIKPTKLWLALDELKASREVLNERDLTETLSSLEAITQKR